MSTSTMDSLLCSSTLSNRIRILRAIRDRFQKLDRLLKLGRHKRALNTFTQCTHLSRTREQTLHLAKQAFNAAMVLEELGGLGSEDLTLKWLRNCLEMAREAQDSGLADKCLITMVRHLHRSDPDRARICLEAVKSVEDYQVSVARLVLFNSVYNNKQIKDLLDKVLKMFPGGLGETKRLLKILEDKDAGFSVQILEAAFERCADDAMEKEELYSISLELAVSNDLVSECQSLVQDYASWCCTHLKGQRMRTKEFYQRAMSASYQHVKNRDTQGDDEGVLICCRALVFLCSHFKDSDGKKVFLWYYLKALIKTEKLEEAAKVVSMHKISIENNEEFVPMLLELALLVRDFQALDDILTFLVNNKNSGDSSYVILVSFLDKLADVMDSDAVLKLVRHLMASTDPDSEASALLAQAAFSLTLSKFNNDSKSDKDELLRALSCLAKEALDSFRQFGHAEWAVKVMWNLCLEVKSNLVRFWSLSVIRQMLNRQDELLLSCLLLQLSTAVAIADKGRPTYDVREEISKLLGQIDRVAAKDTTERQRRLVAVYRTKLAMLTEERFMDLAKVITAMMLDKGNDGRTLALMAGLMRRADPSRTAACTGVGYGKLVCRIFREAITRSGKDGANLDEVMELFSDLIAYSTMNCSSFQGASDMDDLVAFLRGLDEDVMPQDHVAKLLALLWNQGLAMILTGQEEERGRELQGMARALAPYAKKYRLYFQEMLNSAPITREKST